MSLRYSYSPHLVIIPYFCHLILVLWSKCYLCIHYSNRIKVQKQTSWSFTCVIVTRVFRTKQLKIKLNNWVARGTYMCICDLTKGHQRVSSTYLWSQYQVQTQYTCTKSEGLLSVIDTTEIANQVKVIRVFIIETTCLQHSPRSRSRSSVKVASVYSSIQVIQLLCGFVVQWVEHSLSDP